MFYSAHGVLCHLLHLLMTVNTSVRSDSLDGSPGAEAWPRGSFAVPQRSSLE